MAQSFYLVVGLSRDVHLERIESAYRRLVQQLGSDLGRRLLAERVALLREEDDKHQKGVAEGEGAERESERPIVSEAPRHRAEPSESRRSFSAPRPFEGMVPLHGTVDEFFGGWVPGFFHTGRQSSGHKDLFVELILSRVEAVEGGLFPLHVPVKQLCPTCAGTGEMGGIRCPECRGGVLDYHEVRISVPPNVTDGQRASLTLGDVGLPGVVLNVLVTVR